MAGLGAIERSAPIAALALALAVAALAGSSPSAAQGSAGGVSPTIETGAEESEAPTQEPPRGLPRQAATSILRGERALAPRGAPLAVKRVIAAANRIRTRPYVWGGGHRRWLARGYDCSGSVSFVLHAGGLLDTSMVSGTFMKWGAPGPGRWITIYANRTHVYAVIAGLRWDTVGDPAGTSGPRWHAEPPYPKGFIVRHPVGY